MKLGQCDCGQGYTNLSGDEQVRKISLWIFGCKRDGLDGAWMVESGREWDQMRFHVSSYTNHSMIL